MFKLQSNLRGLITVFALFTSITTFAQNTISGTIKDDKNQPLAGVSVAIKGTTKQKEQFLIVKEITLLKTLVLEKRM